jgi:3-hydroxyisobutyrate dehydrogenase-like beta-hydroxyacid dehydrogenase
MNELCDFGLIGLAVMGENLALNVESRGFRIAVFNRTVDKVDALMAGRAKGKNFVGCHSLPELVKTLARPRKVMMLVKAGDAVDQFIEQLIPLLEPGDVIIDGGNEHYTNTERRTKYVESKGLLYVGTGVSGGEEGALASDQADLSSDRGKSRPEKRHPLLRMGRSSRRRALRQNGAQRHRVRRYAADLRSVPDAERGTRSVQ